MVVDKDSNVVYVSESFFKIKGIEWKDPITNKCRDIHKSDDCFTEDCPLQRIIKTGEKFEKEEWLQGDEGRIPYLLRCAPYTDAEGHVVGVVISYKNIVDEKNARQMSEMQALQQGRIEMANNMLHDIGNALMGISVYALKPQAHSEWKELKSLEQLKDLFISNGKALTESLGADKNKSLLDFMDALIASIRQRNESDIDFFKKISVSVNHISSVLDLQRRYINEKELPLASDVDMKNIVQDTLLMLSASLEKRSVRIKLETSDKVPIVSGDKTRLIRVFLNILKNIYESFDHVRKTISKDVKICISADEERGEAKIVFIDNASGFSKDIADKLFDRGFTTKEYGSGIGLHECRSIIESHGGSIELASEGKDKGAQMAIILPLTRTRQAND
jgi:signal transduction histidine kinase